MVKKDHEECWGIGYDKEVEVCTEECLDKVSCKSITLARTGAITPFEGAREPVTKTKIKEEKEMKKENGKKTAAKKTAPKKDAPKKTAAKKTAAKKTAEKKTAPKKAANGEKKDEFGFRTGTKRSGVMVLLAEGKHTMEEIGEKLGKVNVNMIKGIASMTTKKIVVNDKGVTSLK